MWNAYSDVTVTDYSVGVSGEIHADILSPCISPGPFRTEGIKASDVLPILKEKVAFVSGECQSVLLALNPQPSSLFQENFTSTPWVSYSKEPVPTTMVMQDEHRGVWSIRSYSSCLVTLFDS